MIRIRTSPPSGQPWKRRSIGRWHFPGDSGGKPLRKGCPDARGKPSPVPALLASATPTQVHRGTGGGQARGEGRGAALSGFRGPHPTWLDGRGSTSTQEGNSFNYRFPPGPIYPVGLIFFCTNWFAPQVSTLQPSRRLSRGRVCLKASLRVLGWVARALSARDARTGFGQLGARAEVLSP